MTTLKVKRSVLRGCGTRAAGAIYATTDREQLIDSGIPIEYFALCPPWPIENIQAIGLSDQGVHIQDGAPFGRPGINDIWAVVGAGSYYVPDYWTEGEAIGFSWRIPKTAPLEKLTMDSRQIMVSRKAYVDNIAELPDRQLIKTCPVGNENHNSTLDEMCLGHLWELVGDPHQDGIRQYSRVFPTIRDPLFSYKAAFEPEGFSPAWKYGAFMWLPIHMFEVINDSVESTHEQALRLLEESGTNIPYELVSE